jgi:hypothetical protein
MKQYDSSGAFTPLKKPYRVTSELEDGINMASTSRRFDERSYGSRSPRRVAIRTKRHDCQQEIESELDRLKNSRGAVVSETRV